MSTVTGVALVAAAAVPFAAASLARSEILGDRRARAATAIVVLKCVVIASLALVIAD
jgi:hypothetical protein